ncbi:metal ABC transporter ATPase [Pseudomonas fluorescens]|nr:metal ABC transporter ATPase [Pseudomonas fluorescens]OPB12706.1 metal ABC transporter ATPase [Pseudomonas fluorescens]OPB25106.1 metal ABC transporter ATPase [Pseudomonas fluorescens]
MNLQTLSELAEKGEIQELQLLSLEGGFYIARVKLEHGEKTLLDDNGKTLRLRSSTHLRDLLQHVPAFPCVLVQQCVHDEMCGVRDGAIGALRIPFSLVAPF